MNRQAQPPPQPRSRSAEAAAEAVAVVAAATVHHPTVLPQGLQPLDRLHCAAAVAATVAVATVAAAAAAARVPPPYSPLLPLSPSPPQLLGSCGWLAQFYSEPSKLARAHARTRDARTHTYRWLAMRACRVARRPSSGSAAATSAYCPSTRCACAMWYAKTCCCSASARGSATASLIAPPAA